MFSIEYNHKDNDDYVTEITHTETQTAETYGHIPYHQLRVSADDGQLINNGSDTELVTVEVVNGLQVVQNETPADAVDYNGDVTVSVEGIETTKSVTNGTTSFDITTQKSASSSIEVTAESLSEKPAESDDVEIEVVK
jgi:hypothetical protein